MSEIAENVSNEELPMEIESKENIPEDDLSPIPQHSDVPSIPEHEDESAMEIEYQETATEETITTDSVVNIDSPNSELNSKEALLSAETKIDLKETESDSLKVKPASQVEQEVQEVSQNDSVAVELEVQEVSQNDSAAVEQEVQEVSQNDSAGVEEEVQEGSQNDSAAVEQEEVSQNDSAAVEQEEVSQNDSVAVELEAQEVSQNDSAAVEQEVQEVSQNGSAADESEIQQVSQKDSSAVESEVQQVSQKDSTVVESEVQQVSQNNSSAVESEVQQVSQKDSTAVESEVQQVSQNNSIAVGSEVQLVSQIDSIAVASEVQEVPQNDSSAVKSDSKEVSVTEPGPQTEPIVVEPIEQNKISITECVSNTASEQIIPDKSNLNESLHNEEVSVVDSNMDVESSMTTLQNAQNGTSLDETDNELKAKVISDEMPAAASSNLKTNLSSPSEFEPENKKRRMDDGVDSCPTGLYLDKTVVPILRTALITLDRLRPQDPLQFVIDFLLQNKEQYS